MIKAQRIFHGLSDKHSGLLITTSLEGCTHRLADVGNRVHTRNDSDEDVRGNAYKQTNSLSLPRATLRLPPVTNIASDVYCLPGKFTPLQCYLAFPIFPQDISIKP